MKNMTAEGYKHIWTLSKGEHILLDTNTGNYEVWFANKNHASYGLNYKNMHLEFARSVTRDDTRNFAIDWQGWVTDGRTVYSRELVEWADIFETLARKHHLTNEFKENGII